MSGDDEGRRVGDDFYQSLLDLTENSRPIITSLTEIANENIIYADKITKSLEQRIKNCLPNYKLFALYLMDSICKNIGNPYNVLFGLKLYSIFTQVYSTVSDAIRTKLINLFKTWKAGTTLTGLPLFPQDQIDKIEQFLIKATASTRIDKNYLINDCKDLMALIQKRLTIDINNHHKIVTKLEALRDLLKMLMENNQSQDELKFILEHFKSARAEEVQILQRLEYEQRKLQELLLVQQQQQQQQLQPPVVKTENTLGFNLSDLSNLLQSTKRKSPQELLELVSKQNIKIHKPSVSADYLRFILNSVVVESQTVEDVLSKYGKIDQSTILDTVPTNDELNLLYNRKKFKCSTCGKRFRSQIEIQPHLDWHFRNNKNLKVTSSKTIQSRNYYIDDSSFVNFKEIDIVGYGDVESSKSRDVSDVIKSKILEEKKNQRHYVVVNTDSMDTKCSICKETIKGKYDDDTNEWIWDNCIEVKQKHLTKIYHWTCYSENYAASAQAPAQVPASNSTGLNFDLNLLKNLVNQSLSRT